MSLVLVAAPGLAVTTALGSGRRAAVRDGGTFRAAAARGDAIDPARGQGAGHLDDAPAPRPPPLAATPEAVQAPVSGAGPYYIAEYVPGQRLVLRRNSYYRGPRRPRVGQIVVSFFSDNVGAMEAVADGQADWADPGRGLGAGP